MSPCWRTAGTSSFSKHIRVTVKAAAAAAERELQQPSAQTALIYCRLVTTPDANTVGSPAKSSFSLIRPQRLSNLTNIPSTSRPTRWHQQCETNRSSSGCQTDRLRSHESQRRNELAVFWINYHRWQVGESIQEMWLMRSFRQRKSGNRNEKGNCCSERLMFLKVFLIEIQWNTSNSGFVSAMF